MTEARGDASPNQSTRRVAVLVSGAGTNLGALLEAERLGALAGRVALVVADRDCAALRRAADAGVPAVTLRPADYASREAWDAALQAALRDARTDLVVLAGFMRVLGPAVLAAFRGRCL